MSEHQNSFAGAVCQHVRLNGARCTQPARRNSDSCRFHDAAMKPLPAAHNLNDQLPVLEDADSIQIALMRLLRYLMKGPIDRKDISTLLYGLQLASTNLARQSQQSERVPGPCEARAGIPPLKTATDAIEPNEGTPSYSPSLGEQAG